MNELIMPKMGESVAEATILKWLKNEGDTIEADEPVLEIATDKVDSEVPSPTAGVLQKRMFNEGDVVKVGEVIALIAASGESTQPSKPAVTASAPPVTPTPSVAPAPSAKPVAVAAPAATASEPLGRTSPSGKFFSPLVRTIAREEGVSLQELEALRGSGQNERITKQDLLNYIGRRGKDGAPAATPAQAKTSAPERKASPAATPAISVSGGDEIIEMDRMRKLIADHMVMSKQTSPHVTSYVEADVTNIVKWRERIKKQFESREKEKLTYTPVFLEAVVKAIRDFPMVNVSVDGTRIIVKRNINLGMATALPSGNLIVPVIRNADSLNLLGLTKAVNDLANRARNNRLLPDEVQGGTYTVTNVGTFGNVMGTPIINQPQVAILAVGAIRKKPAVIETEQGDFIGIRHMMFLSHSYDHRVVDGALGGSFVRRVADYLEQFDPQREI